MTSGSPAEVAGVLKGDVIYMMGNVDVSTKTFRQTTLGLGVGATTTLRVLRLDTGSWVDLPVTIGAAPWTAP